MLDESITNALLTTAIVLGAAGLFWWSFQIIRPWERGVIARMGKHHRVRSSGPAFVLPLAETLTAVDMRETVFELPHFEAKSEDGIVLNGDAALYYEVIDPVQYIHRVRDFSVALRSATTAALHLTFSKYSLDSALSDRNGLGRDLLKAIGDQVSRWGIAATRFEIHRLDPPLDILEAHKLHVRAERVKRATILEAEGAKQAVILSADGELQARLMASEAVSQEQRRLADAERYRRITLVEAEVVALEKLCHAFNIKKPNNDVLVARFIDAIRPVSGENPLARVSDAFSSVKAMNELRTLFQALPEKVAPEKAGEK